MAARKRTSPATRRRSRASPHSTLLAPTTLQRIRPSHDKPVALAWAPSGAYLAVATQYGPIFLFHVLTSNKHVVHPNPIRTFRGHAADVMHMSFSRGDFLLTASMDRSILLWHVHNDRCLQKILHPDMVTSVAFHPRDQSFGLSGGCDGVVRLWRLPDHTCIAHAHVGAVVTAAHFGPDGTRAFVGTYDGRVLVLHVKQLLEHASKHLSDSSTTADVPPDITIFAQPQVTTDNFATTPVLQVDNIVDTRQRTSRRKSPGPKVGSMCVRSHEKETVVVTSDARVHVFGRDGHVVSRLKASVRKEGNVPLGSSISPDGRYMLHDAVGGVIRMLDLNRPQKAESNRRRERDLPATVEIMPVVTEGHVSTAAFACAAALNNIRPGRDNNGAILLAVGLDDGSVRIIESGPAR